MSPQATADAVLDFLRAATDLGVYEPSQAPKAADPPHAVASFDLGRPGTPRLGSPARSKVWRILLRVIGHTENNARWAAGEIYTAIDGGVQVPVPGTRSRTQVRVESSTTVELDDIDVPGVYSGLIVVTFASSPTA